MASTEAQRAAVRKYLGKLKDVRLRIDPKEYEKWTTTAKQMGYTKRNGEANMKQFIYAAVNEKIDRA